MTTASRVSDSRVTDEMVDAALRTWYLVLTKDKRADMRAALEAALACQGPVVEVSDLRDVVSKMDKVGDMLDDMGSYSYTAVEDIVYSYQLELTALIAKAQKVTK